MRGPSLRGLIGGLVLLVVSARPAGAVQYRLQVAHLYQDSFAHYYDGALGTGSGELVMDRLERALDAGEVPSGALLSDRTFRYGWEALAASFRATKVIVEIKPASGPGGWDEAVWDGAPGERSVWVIGETTSRTQEVTQVALYGVPLTSGEAPGLRFYIPYRVTANPSPRAVVSYSLDFLRFYESRGPVLWDRYLSRSLGLGQGIAVVVGENSNPSLADWVYIVIQHPPQPATFKVVVGWEHRRSADRPNFEGVSPRK